jgi:hypothetical protein
MSTGQLFEPGAATAGLPAPVGWPAPPAPAAYTGLAGEIVAVIAPHTEADPVALLAQLLVAFGAAAGRGAWFAVEATRHHPHEFLILVGDSARARKGSSWDRVHALIATADPGLAARTTTGLSSGEGLIWHVRDPTDQDAGAKDRRLLDIEPEFASVLKQSNRDQSTLSPVLRSAWDGRPLALLTRTAPAQATDAHISVIGHITAAELRHQTRAVELANGFLNRFLIFCCRRVRLLPDGGEPDPLAGTDHGRRLARHLKTARDAGQVRLTDPARELWHHAYARFAAPEPAPEAITAITARAEAHAIRLALLHALINGRHRIDVEHLQAALALIDYARRSATYAFSAAVGQPLADTILAALAHTPKGLTRSQIRDLFHRNQIAGNIDSALSALHSDGKITATRVLTGGRPANLWTVTKLTPNPRTS